MLFLFSSVFCRLIVFVWVSLDVLKNIAESLDDHLASSMKNPNLWPVISHPIRDDRSSIREISQNGFCDFSFLGFPILKRLTEAWQAAFFRSLLASSNVTCK